jgi:hypothetical protein
MGTSVAERAQSPFNLILPVKSWLDLKKLGFVYDTREREMVDAREALGTLHFARFVELHDHNRLGYFTVFDGDFRTYLGDFLPYFGPTFDALFKHVVDPPPVPCEKNREAFITWCSVHNPESIGFYSAHPTVSVKEIRARSGTEFGRVDAGEQSALTIVLPMKSPTHLAALSRSLNQFLPELYAKLDSIGTVHFFRFVPLGTDALALVGEHDGEFAKLAEDFWTHLGPMFDEIFENAIGAPPTPVRENRAAFTDWFIRHNLKTWGLYSAYPALSVKNVRVLAGTWI